MGNFGVVRIAGRDIPLTASIVDQQASLYGHRCRRPGDTKITFGTGAFALAITGDCAMRAPGNGLLPTLAWQSMGKTPTYALDGGVYCAGSAINWAKSLGLFSTYDEINLFASPSAIARNLAFVPALTGLGCPYWDGSAAGLWIGMSLDTSAQDMVQAVLEGISLRAAQVIDAMSEQISIGSSISIDGGLSANPYFCQFLCDVLQKQIVVPIMGEITAMGTALMAMGTISVRDLENTQYRGYEPAAPREEYKARFAEAVSRSRNWRE